MWIAGDRLALTSTQWERRVASTLARWVEDSGIEYEVQYLGGTSTPCHSLPAGPDGHSVVAAAQQSPFGMSVRGYATCYSATGGACTFGGDAAEYDVCIYRALGAMDIEADMAASPDGAWDVVSTLAHEFGHVLGLFHTAGAAMQSGGHGLGALVSRSPLGDDRDGLLSFYPSRGNTVFSREISSTGPVGAAVPLPMQSTWQPSGVTAWHSGAARLVVATTNINGSVTVASSQLPVTSASTFSGRTVPADAFGMASLAATSTQPSGTLVLAAPNRTEVWSEVAPVPCAGVALRRSTNLFQTYRSATASDVCTPYSVGIAWVAPANRWLMSYVFRGSRYDARTDRIHLRTSADGLVWPASSEVVTDFYSSDGPSVSCQGALCILSWLDDSSDVARAANAAVTVWPNGTPVVLSWSVDSSLTAPRSPAGTVFEGAVFAQVLHYGSASEVAGGVSSLRFRSSSVVAMPYSGTWQSLTYSARGPVQLTPHSPALPQFMLWREP